MTKESANKDKNQKTRFNSTVGDRCQIKAYAPAGTDGADRLIIFNRGQIDYVFEDAQPGLSGILLDSGVTISVHMSLPELNNIIRSPGLKKDAVVDLSAVTKGSASPVIGNDAASAVAGTLEIGTRMPDGTVYVGLSPETDLPMYAAPVDAPELMTFRAACNYAEGLQIGHKNNFRLPTPSELQVLFVNREKGALKGTFNDAGVYRSGAETPGYNAFIHDFSTGQAAVETFWGIPTRARLSVRCVC